MKIGDSINTFLKDFLNQYTPIKPLINLTIIKQSYNLRAKFYDGVQEGQFNSCAYG